MTRIGRHERDAVGRRIRLRLASIPADLRRMADLGASRLGIVAEDVVYSAATDVLGPDRASGMSDAQIASFFARVREDVAAFGAQDPAIDLRDWR
jgi:hypothetical protein